jgi:parallel beta-helix repeat protein
MQNMSMMSAAAQQLHEIIFCASPPRFLGMCSINFMWDGCVAISTAKVIVMNCDIQTSYPYTLLRPILIVCALLMLIIVAAGVAAGAEWHVYPGAGTPIQTAIDGAEAGDTIYVHAGTYVENVDVDKRVTLVSDGADVVTVWASSAEDHVFEVTADWVNVSGFTVAGASGGTAGVYLNGADHCNISDNTASNNCRGIYLHHYSSNNVLIENNVSDNNHGIDLRHYSSNNVLIENNVSDNKYSGIDLSESSHNTLIENYCCSNNYRGILACLSSKYNTFTDNTANSNNDYGIYLSSLSNYNTLTGNTASDNDYGIYLHRSSSNTLTENHCCSNNYRGIYLRDSSDNNIVYHNNFNNTQNAYDSCINTWDSGSAGNYYSDYTGADPDGDGIGEDTYPIPGGDSIDRFPLMHPWSDTSQKGDLNGDDKTTPADAAIVLAFAAGGSASCDPATLAAADVSGDNRVTALDALMILQAAAGAIDL